MFGGGYDFSSDGDAMSKLMIQNGVTDIESAGKINPHAEFQVISEINPHAEFQLIGEKSSIECISIGTGYMESNVILTSENTDSTICLVDSSNVMDSNLESIHNNVDLVILGSNKISDSSKFKTKCEAMVLMYESFQIYRFLLRLVGPDSVNKGKDILVSSLGNMDNIRLGQGSCCQTKSNKDYITDVTVQKHHSQAQIVSNFPVSVGTFLILDWNGIKEKDGHMDIDNKKDMFKLVQPNIPKSYAQTVSFNSNSVDATIKVIPKLVGSKVGEVEIPYSNLMLGSAPYHSTLYGYFIEKPLGF
ncbi:hypothetical protein L1887_14794 [Cichorium endivia]|nr:hypothetical protein L1887_14794 [Cichorium endivia]